jgi:putative FmdB family regulatory protein
LPLYEYECPQCGRFEKIEKFSSRPLKVCPTCGKRGVERLLSAPAIQFKGSGWYITDYARKSEGKSDGKPDAGADSKGESKGEKSDSKSAEKGDGGGDKPAASPSADSSKSSSTPKKDTSKKSAASNRRSP